MNPRPPQPPADDPERDTQLGAALSGLPVPDHGPTFWADLADRLAGHAAEPDEAPSPTTAPQPTLPEGETAVPSPTPPDLEVGPTREANPISLDDRRARRAAVRGRGTRSLGAAAAAVALVVAAAGAVSVIRQDDDTDQVATGGRPTSTTQAAGPAGPTAGATSAAPAEFSATYQGIDAPVGASCPAGRCLPWRLTVARDGSFRWTRDDDSVDIAYDASTGTGHRVEVVAGGAGASPEEPNVVETTGVPAGGPDRRIAVPEPLGPIGDFVVALARAGDPRVTAGTSQTTGRAVWRYDGPTVRDRLGGEGAPNHAVAEVDQASGVLLELVRSADGTVIGHFSASEVSTSDRIDRSRYELSPPPGADRQRISAGFVFRPLDEAAGMVPYDLLVPATVPDGFTLDSARSVAVNRDEPWPTGPEGGNPPTVPVVAMTWRNGAQEFTVTLRPSGGRQWDDPFGAEGMVPDRQPVRLELDGPPPLEGAVTVDAPLRPHLWGITGGVVVTVSGDLPRAELEMVAGSLRAHRD